MKRYIRYYSHEIYSVITILFILVSAIWITPDITQKFALVYAFIFLLHEWEENNYPGGFFNVLFGEVICLEKVPEGNKLKESRLYVYILVVALTFVPYFLHTHMWLLLPVVYLGLLEGLVHSIIMPKVFKLNKSYTPGMITAICLFVLSVVVLCFIIPMGTIKGWQYILGVFLILIGLAFMAINGMRYNGVHPGEIPKRAICRLKELYGK